MKYMLLFCGTREAQRAFEAMTPVEQRRFLNGIPGSTNGGSFSPRSPKSHRIGGIHYSGSPPSNS